MNEQRFQLGAEEEILSDARNIKWFDPHAVACQHDAFLGFCPERNRKHSTQSEKTILIPLKERAENGLRVGVRREAVSEFFELGPQLQMIVNLAVENDSGVAVFRQNRL